MASDRHASQGCGIPTVDAPGSITVVVADDDPGVRGALVDLLDSHPDLHVVGVAENGSDAARLCQQLRPSIVVVDVMMPMGGEAAIRAVRAVAPSTTIVVYTAVSDRRVGERLLAAGAAAVLVKGSMAHLGEELADLGGASSAPLA